MPGPFFRIELRMLPTEQGGRRGAVLRDYRPSWNLGNTWLGRPTINDGRVTLEACDALAPGERGLARIEPLAPEHWGRVGVGSVIAMQEGSRVVGHATILEIVECPAYWTPAVARFVDEARQYGAFVAKAGEVALDERLRGARQRLLALYEAGSALPDVESDEGISAGPSPAVPAGWPGFAERDLYWEVFDPYEQATPVAGSLSDDLLDVYRDVQRGLALWDRGEASRSAAVWEWRFHFGIHWGNHAIDALRALHRACDQAIAAAPSPRLR